MIEKLKAFIQSAKDVLIWIIAPILFAAGYIAYLITENKKLTGEVTGAKDAGKLDEVTREQAQIDAKANADVSDFDTLYKRYRDSTKPPADL